MSADHAAIARKLLTAIAARDYGVIAECFAHDADFRVLTPRELRAHTSAREAAERYRFWLDDLGDFELLERDVEEIADRTRIHYRFTGQDPEKGPRVNDHTGYAVIVNGRIASMTLTCSGFRPASAP